MSVALIRAAEVVPTKDDLAAIANREHEHAIGAASAMVRHAMNAGDALLAAKAQTAPGRWTRWLRERFVASPETANVYMTLAHHREAIEGNLEVKSISQARRFLREIGTVREPHGSQGRGVYVLDSVRDEARAMRREGRGYREIAEALGTQVSTVHGWCNPDSVHSRRQRQAKSKARRREAARALKRQERDRAAAKIGGTVAESYSLIRKTTQHVDRAAGAEENVEVRAALNLALTKLHAAEDAIVRALGIA